MRYGTALTLCSLVLALGCEKSTPAPAPAVSEPPAQPKMSVPAEVVLAPNPPKVIVPPAPAGPPVPIEAVAVLPFTGDWDRPDTAIPKDEWAKKTRQHTEMVEDRLANQFVAKSELVTFKIIPPKVIRSRKASAPTSAESLLELGKELKVGAVLTGAVGSNGQLTLQLVDVPSGELLWGGASNFIFRVIGTQWVVDYYEEQHLKVVTEVAGVVGAVNKKRSARP